MQLVGWFTDRVAFTINSDIPSRMSSSFLFLVAPLNTIFALSHEFEYQVCLVRSRGMHAR